MRYLRNAVLPRLATVFNTAQAELRMLQSGHGERRGEIMVTIFDWLAVGLFGAIALLFLQRSASAERKGDGIALYLPPVLLCALGNWLGNNAYDLLATVALFAGLAYFILVLRPGQPPRA